MQIDTQYGRLTVTEHVIQRWHERFKQNKTALQHTLGSARRPNKKRGQQLQGKRPQAGRFFLEFSEGVFVVVNQQVVTVWPNQRPKPQLAQIADGLMAMFDHQMDAEKQYRSNSEGSQRDYHDGRVDGIDTGRYLVEKFLAEQGGQL